MRYLFSILLFVLLAKGLLAAEPHSSLAPKVDRAGFESGRSSINEFARTEFRITFP